MINDELMNQMIGFIMYQMQVEDATMCKLIDAWIMTSTAIASSHGTDPQDVMAHIAEHLEERAGDTSWLKAFETPTRH